MTNLTEEQVIEGVEKIILNNYKAVNPKEIAPKILKYLKKHITIKVTWE